jgi:hypothetical protein
LFHFVMVLIYVNPFAQGQKRQDYWAQYYVYPFFQQRWDLFVPPVDNNYMLFAGEDSVRVNIFREINEMHQSNRFQGYEYILQAFANSIFMFEKNTPLQLKLNGPIKDDVRFKIIEHAAEAYLRKTGRLNKGPVKLMLVVYNVLTKESRVYYN